MADIAPPNSTSAAKKKALLDSIPSKWQIPADKVPHDSDLDVTSFPENSGFFTSDELEITTSSTAQLLEKTHSQTWTSEQVATAFCKRASVAHQLTNCLSETLFDHALSTARSLDAHIRETGKPVGPLHGLPISIKDNFQIKGKDSTIGFLSWVNSPSTTNSVLVDLLIKAGAILYVKTNVPTAMMIAETVNNVFGRTTNPLNRSLTPGGSSGGESALIAFHGSPLGIGTDIGGSLRIPAACTALFTLRPSLGRFPTSGAKSALSGQEAVNSVNGPLAHDLDTIELFARSVIAAEPWSLDPKCLPIPWRPIPSPPNLRLAVLLNDGIVTPTPPVQRALAATVEKLRTAGHELIPWEPTHHAELLSLLSSFFLADGGESVRSLLTPVSEPWRPEMRAYETATDLGVYKLWGLQAKRTALATAYLARVKEAGVDAILCPTTPYASTRHGTFRYVGYTGVWNVLDYSAVSFPCGVVADKGVDVWEDGLEGDVGERSEDERKVRDEYDAEAVHGIPVSLQLVAGRLEEEKVIAMTRRVLEAL